MPKLFIQTRGVAVERLFDSNIFGRAECACAFRYRFAWVARMTKWLQIACVIEYFFVSSVRYNVVDVVRSPPYTCLCTWTAERFCDKLCRPHFTPSDSVIKIMPSRRFSALSAYASKHTERYIFVLCTVSAAAYKLGASGMTAWLQWQWIEFLFQICVTSRKIVPEFEIIL